MDFNRTQLTDLFTGLRHEKAKYINILHKIKTLIALCNDHKLILNQNEKIMLTSSPRIIFESINFMHPILKILLEFLEKTERQINGDRFFINALTCLIDQISTLLDNGVKSKVISDLLKDISNIKYEEISNKKEKELVDGIENMKVSEEAFTLSDSVKEIIKGVVGDDHVSNLLVESIQATRSFSVEKIRVFKVGTGSFEDSYAANGMIIDKTPEGNVKCLKNTSVGLFNCPLDICRTELKGTLVFNTHQELLDYSIKETESIKKLVDSLNVNVLIVCGNINEQFMDFVNHRNILVLRTFNKYDLIRICDLVGGTIYNTFGPVKMKGRVGEIGVFEDGGKFFTKIVSTSEDNDKCLNVRTIVLKHSVKEVLDETERKINYVLNCLNSKKSYDMQKPMTNFVVSDDDFTSNVISYIKRKSSSSSSDAITGALCKSLANLEDVKMVLSDKAKVMGYAFSFLATILEIDDYLVARLDKLDVKPRDNPNWDED